MFAEAGVIAQGWVASVTRPARWHDGVENANFPAIDLEMR